MKLTQTPIKGLFTIEPLVHKDSRGFFLETFREDFFKANKISCNFVQDNHACSEAIGVVRGMHFQAPPFAQNKLIRVTKGSIYDVAIDIRLGSETFGHYFGCILSAENFQQLFVPKGFAHGYMTLEKGTEVQYKVDNYYNPQAEGGLRWNDQSIAINWPKIEQEAVVADRDNAWPLLASFVSPFK